jgi:signal transduction histidine kinase/DNA-binding response OmpR family regulator
LRFSNTLAHNSGFLLALVLVGLLAWQGQRTASAVLANNDEVRRSLELISAIKETRSAMLDVETGARGFVLTGKEDFLQPYAAGRRNWGRAYGNLRALLRGRQPPREAWLAELSDTAGRRLRISATSIAFRRSHGLEESAAFNAGLGGKQAMDHIRMLLDDLEAEERGRLAAGRVDIQSHYREARDKLVFGGTIVSLLLLASLLAINLNLRTRRRLERHALEQQVFLRGVVDADQSLVYVRNGDGRIALCNAAFADVFARKPVDLEGRTPEDGGIASKAATLLEGDRDIASGRRGDFHDEVAVHDVAGHERWFQRMKGAMLLPGGKRMALTVAIDISARRNVERMKAEFVSTVSHELRTPLTAIRGSLGMLVSGMAGEVDPVAKPLLAIANSSCERLVRLINDILDIEKLESGRIELLRTRLRVRDAIAQAIEQNGPYARQHDVRLEAVVDGDPWVDADPDRFAQVMANLLSNATKHSPAGSVVRVDAARKGRVVAFGVRDHGAGVPEGFRARLFERFAQADSSDARQRGGTGLGLAITRSLVLQHGGAIGFEDAPGGGTRFHFTLPVATQGVEVGVLPAPEDGTPVLLVVDDDPESARDLGTILATPGYRCVVAADGTGARAMLAHEPVAAVLVNLGLRGEDPLAFIRELRNASGYRHMPVLAFGTRSDGDEGIAGSAIGIGDWLRKPFDADRVVAAVRACVDPGTATHALHVEDDEDLRAMVAGLLAGETLALHGAGTLSEARAALAARHHALVILDLMLPDGDGAELLGELASARPPTRVIIFSARDSALPESAVILRRLVKSQHGGTELASLVQAQLRHWPHRGDNGT